MAAFARGSAIPRVGNFEYARSVRPHAPRHTRRSTRRRIVPPPRLRRRAGTRGPGTRLSEGVPYTAGWCNGSTTDSGYFFRRYCKRLPNEQILVKSHCVTAFLCPSTASGYAYSSSLMSEVPLLAISVFRAILAVKSPSSAGELGKPSAVEQSEHADVAATQAVAVVPPTAVRGARFESAGFVSNFPPASTMGSPEMAVRTPARSGASWT